jgi:hypothetical protein
LSIFAHAAVSCFSTGTPRLYSFFAFGILILPFAQFFYSYSFYFKRKLIRIFTLKQQELLKIKEFPQYPNLNYNPMDPVPPIPRAAVPDGCP